MDKDLESDARSTAGDGRRRLVASTLRFADADRAIAAIAARQHGVATRDQLVAVGVSAGVVQRRVAANHLRRLHRGVYLVGPVESDRARLLAAVLACPAVVAGRESTNGFDSASAGTPDEVTARGQATQPTATRSRNGAATGTIRSVVSHSSAAALFGLDRAGPLRIPIHVTVAGADPRRPGIRFHRVAALSQAEVTIVDGIPVTTPARTLLDLASVMSSRDLERALTDALGRRLATHNELIGLVDRHPRRRGASLLRSLLGSDCPSLLRSETERLFRSLVREAGLPEPEANAKIGEVEVDFLWSQHRLVVEVDGAAYHATSDRFETDRRRDRALVAAGCRVIRVTWRQIKHERLKLAVQIAQALWSGAPSATGLRIGR